MSTATRPRTDTARVADLNRTIDLYAIRRPVQGGAAARAAIIRATRLACMVRDESADTIGPYLDELDTDGLYALVVTLAAMVDPDDVIEDRLGWLTPLGVELERQGEADRKAAPAGRRRMRAARAAS